VKTKKVVSKHYPNYKHRIAEREWARMVPDPENLKSFAYVMKTGEQAAGLLL
jgi:hypothetical protein